MKVRLYEHQSRKGAKYTQKRLPVTLVYYEEFEQVDFSFEREKQVHGWNRAKKEALIANNYEILPELSKSKKNYVR